MTIEVEKAEATDEDVNNRLEALRQRFLTEDPLFRHIHDVDERRRP